MKANQLLKNLVLTELESAVSSYLTKQKIDLPLTEFKIRIEYSRDEKFGDYSSPFALENKNILKLNPKEIAEGVLSEIKNETLFEFVTFSPPGFINFRIRSQFLIQYTNQVMSPMVTFAKTDEKQSILLEFVSANPTGPMNIVSARSAAYGDALANLLLSLGHTVKREFYVNDYGNQVYLLGVAVLLRIFEEKGEKISFQEDESKESVFTLIEKRILPKESYRGEYIRDIAKEVLSNKTKSIQVEEWIQNKNWDECIHDLSKYAVEYNLSRQKEDLKLFGVHFDQFFSERSLHEAGDVENVPTLLKKEDVSTIDGKLHFLSTQYGDDKDRVIRREDGRPTYLMADIAYHFDKYKRGFTKLIDIWGPDHYGYIARLKGAVLSFGKSNDSFLILIAQQVNLIENKEKVKMSKRLGIFQTMRDLLSYLGKNGKDVGRYFFLMRSSDAPLDFDLDLAKDESDKNPVFYIQYAHARICSIFRELQISIADWSIPKVVSGDCFQSEERLRLLFWVARFQEEVYDTATNLEPHRLTNYLQSLSKAFTKFYSHKDNRIKEKQGEEREQLLFLILFTKRAIASGLELLGISSPEKMSKEDESNT
ncbi:Arginine--tRNA ligase [Leptospira biflexa serovar Patoc strain 'Patoc 1 (Ames)']|uniref:Arginine--tRNA ligase n=2 Tax=Leptospira biflexa serovar Patoc TaxID=145259 RepID=SYR_LEPBP|nr:arginine--tRNA ligase [Leptospira biflexa]B0SB29.1 RecName: Full=Arginine--tRNA ligase; AltName: Full=Arginyl-tRNA synthetase; Short=ArgRS [Leptospira biflexa serovar Patoc strain 'Patoc 1 (Ames)']B0SSV1.1 RecName: Full=Arginine--tRNA ligase; AltName: Full=Arginyl-tRNA synthetase; Short=ArgRS [Leptospira biflexa serovar Patoc strain 'Patoc 1 (Paris)']ABZ94535.1 Arginine--tRNA ligase [Leptospira biflexa serovar Patoc strain 'Patoc 1 (Ames)']ABZ98191.1 Arginyl-tRNA synthetase (Arginine--tRNA l